MCAQIIDARVKQKTGVAADFAGYNLLEGEIALVRTSASGPVWNFKVGPGNFDSLDWSLALSGAAQKADTSTVFPAGVPGLYIPTEDGTYEGVPVDLSVGYVQLIWDGSALTKVEFPIDLAGYATTAQLEPKVNKEDIGIVIFEDGQNIAPFLYSTYANDSNYYSPGFIRTNGNVGTSTAWNHTTDYQSILPGNYTSNLYLEGNAAMVFYDVNFNVISGVSSIGNPTGATDWPLTVPQGARWFKTSRSINPLAIGADYYINSDDTKTLASDTVFMTPDGVDKAFEDRGFRHYPAGTEFLSELVDSDINDTDLWATGFLHYNGSHIQPSSGAWMHTVKKYDVIPGTFQVRSMISGNASIWVYDGNDNVIRTIQNPASPSNIFDEVLTFTSSDKFIRLSFYTSTSTGTEWIRMQNTEDINYFEGQQSIGGLVQQARESDTSNPISSAGTASAVINARIAESKIKSKFPVVTFISDDIHVANFDWYVPALDDLGIKSTFAAITGRVDHPDFADESQIKWLYDNGHDIAGHTHSHLHTGDLTPEEQEYEIRTCKLELLRIIGDDTPMFIAPFGSRTLVTDRLIRQYFDADFVSVSSTQVPSGSFLNVPPIETFRLKRVSFDAVSSDQSLRLQICKDAVDVALANSEWLVFAIHPQYPEYSPTGNPTGYESRRQDLHDLVDYIRSINIPIMTAKNAFAVWKNPFEYGNRALDVNFMELGMDGSRNGTFFA